MENRASRRRFYFYQVRSGLGEDPSEILTRLTHHVWRVFEFSAPALAADPHLWPEIFRLFRNTFKNRLSFTPACGHEDECAAFPCVLCGRSLAAHAVKPKSYLLETRRPLDHFFRLLSAVFARRLSRGKKDAPTLRHTLDRQLRTALEENFFVSDLCPRCPARETPADRRIWAREALEPPWGGWRNVTR